MFWNCLKSKRAQVESKLLWQFLCCHVTKHCCIISADTWTIGRSWQVRDRWRHWNIVDSYRSFLKYCALFGITDRKCNSKRSRKINKTFNESINFSDSLINELLSWSWLSCPSLVRVVKRRKLYLGEANHA